MKARQGDGPADLGGIYITDDHIDVVIGGDSRGIVTLAEAPLEIEFDDTARFPFGSEDIKQTFERAVSWICGRANPRAIGVASYGPIDNVDPKRMDEHSFGNISQLSHGLRLQGANIRDLVRDALPARNRGAVIVVDTDVNAAAMGEYSFRANRNDARTAWNRYVVAFVKISHGIGAGVIQHIEPWHGGHHVELGQVPVQLWYDQELDPDNDELKFAQSADRRYGRLRLESLASVGALHTRLEWSGSTYQEAADDPDHWVWTREAFYAAQCLLTVATTLAPSQIIVSGRIMRDTPGLFEKTEKVFNEMLGSPAFPANDGRLDDFIVRAEPMSLEVGGEAKDIWSGCIGALCLAEKYRRQKSDGRVSRVVLAKR